MSSTKAELEERIESIVQDPSKPVGSSTLLKSINKEEEHKTCQTDELYPKRNVNDFQGKSKIRELWLAYCPKDAYRYHPHITRFQRIKMRKERAKLLKEELLASETSEYYDEVDVKDSLDRPLHKPHYEQSESEKFESSNNSEINDKLSPLPTETMLPRMNLGNLSPQLGSKRETSTPKRVHLALEKVQTSFEESKQTEYEIQNPKSGYLDATISDQKKVRSKSSSEVSSNSEKSEKYKIIGDIKKSEIEGKSKSPISPSASFYQNTSNKEAYNESVAPSSPLKLDGAVYSQSVFSKKPLMRGSNSPIKKWPNNDPSSQSNYTQSQVSRTNSMVRSFRGNKKISGISRLATVRKEAEIKVKKYFTTSVQPDLEKKIQNIEAGLHELIKRETLTQTQLGFERIVKTQKKFQHKNQKMVNDCHARIKEMEEGLFSDVVGICKKNKRDYFDKKVDWKDLYQKCDDNHQEIEQIHDKIFSISDVINLILEFLSVQVNNNIKMFKMKQEEPSEKLPPVGEVSRNMLQKHHRKTSSNANKSLEMWQTRKNRRSPYLNIPMMTTRDIQPQETEVISAKYVYLQKRIIEKCQKAAEDLPKASYPTSRKGNDSEYENPKALQTVEKSKESPGRILEGCHKRNQSIETCQTIEKTKLLELSYRASEEPLETMRKSMNKSMDLSSTTKAFKTRFIPKDLLKTQFQSIGKLKIKR